jgi:hypothetical protein
MRVHVLAALALLGACGHSGSTLTEREGAGVATFQILHPTHDERYLLRTSDPAVIARARAELAKPFAERTLHPNGALLRGDGGYNAPWSWHLADDGWNLVEMSMEVCDAWPGYIEEHLDDWLSQVGSFCPWSSRVEREVTE